jgi:hypothetical protein
MDPTYKEICANVKEIAQTIRDNGPNWTHHESMKLAWSCPEIKDMLIEYEKNKKLNIPFNKNESDHTLDGSFPARK